MIDFTKPVQTQTGTPVRILCTDGPNPYYPVLGIVEGSQTVNYWREDGRPPTFVYGHSLQNVPEPPKVYTVLVFTNVHVHSPDYPMAFAFASEDEALKFRKDPKRRDWHLVRAIENVTQWSVG